MTLEKNELSLEEEIRDLIFERLHIDYIDKAEVDYDAPIFSSFDQEGTGLGLDSIDALELVVALRNKYGIIISQEGMDIFKSIRTIADYVTQNKNK